jgi:undecaprenyl-diphosphatase
MFFEVNECMSNDLFDMIMPLFRDKFFWIPLYFLIIFLIIKKFGLKSVYVLGFSVVTLILADQLSAHVIKPLVMRPRPCNDPIIGDLVHKLVDCGSGFSFVSSHATNHFALALFFISIFLRPSIKYFVIIPFLFWAALISFAQVYVGVHYPLDVMAGGILGAGIGYGIGVLNTYVLCLRCGYKL